MAKWSVGELVTAAKLNTVGFQSSTVILNGTTSYAAPSNCTVLEIEGVGAGGGGSGCAASGATTQVSAYGPGGGGAWGFKVLTTNIGTHVVAVGGGGSAGAITPAGGGNGGDTSLKDTLASVVFLVKGGTGSALNGCGGATAAVVASGGLGGAAGSSTGDQLVSGSTGFAQKFALLCGMMLPGAAPRLGQPPMYSGIVETSATFLTGTTGIFPGGGGGGGMDANNAARAGGAGANGVLMVNAYG